MLSVDQLRILLAGLRFAQDQIEEAEAAVDAQLQASQGRQP